MQSQAQFNENKLILFGILLVACALRFYDYFNLPFSHDEYSAIVRTSYTNFNDLIEFGVKPDFHPAGVQVFLTLWVKIVGTDPWIVKLPFVLMSILSVYLAYKISKKWTNETVGLIVAAFFATTQYTIVLGTYARPYASGLFFTLLLIWTLTNILLNSEHKFWRNWLVFVLAGTACSYNHYVNMMVAGIIGISAFPFVAKQLRLKYSLAGVTIGLLFLPHLSLFLFHISKGGVGGEAGWLRAPEPDFILNYLYYLGHYSICTIVLVGFILIYSWIRGRKISNYSPQFSILKRIYFVFCWFVVPFLICYFYSVEKNPILQISVLIFSHFLIYVFLFGHIKPLTVKDNSLIVVFIVLVNIFTLYVVRQHFYVHYNVGYETVLVQLEKDRKQYPDLPALINTDDRFTNFLQKKWNRKIAFDKYEFENQYDFVAYLDSVSKKSDYFYFVEAGNPSNTVPIILEYFPKIEKQLNNQSNVIYLFSKNGKTNKFAIINHWKLSKEPPEGWRLDSENLRFEDHSWNYIMDSLTEWGPGITFDLKDIVTSPNNIIDIRMEVERQDCTKELIVCANIKDKDSTIVFTGGHSGGCAVVLHSLSVEAKNIKNKQLDVFIWNIGKGRFKIKDIVISVRAGNPYMYSIQNPIYPIDKLFYRKEKKEK